MGRRDIKTRILEEKNSSAQVVQQILSEKNLDEERFSSLFRSYLCAKFLLEPDEITADNFYEICRISAEKTAARLRGQPDAARAATDANCSGATTAMSKKVLFLMAVEREYGISLSPEESAAVDTWGDLCRLVYGKLMVKRSRSGVEADGSAGE